MAKQGFTPLEMRRATSFLSVGCVSRAGLPQRKPCQNSSLTGFTLIEVLIVVAISAMLSAIAIGYSGVQRDQTALSVEETKISQFILQARSLAIATYSNAVGSTCGYGVSFDTSGTYSIFAYVPGGTGCPLVSDISYNTPPSGIIYHEQKYTDETWQVYPQGKITFSSSSPDTLSAVLFYPPDPDTLLFDSSGDLIPQASINVVGANGSTKTISINSAGQVSF